VLEPERRRPGRPPRRPAAIGVSDIAPAVSGPRPVAAFRYKRIGREAVLQQAWQHDGGLEWRAVETVPEQAPDWNPDDASRPS
jgi:hypothetical protein